MRRSFIGLVILTSIGVFGGVAAAGGRWVVAPTVDPGAVASSFQAVSCVSATFCIAVGYEDDSSSTTGTLIEKWDGTSWEIMASPNPTSVSLLFGVSCTSTQHCTAVGYIVPGGTLVETWDGVAWTVQESPNLHGDGDHLLAVSCASPTACVAVGGTRDASTSLSEVWDGISWRVVPPAQRLRTTHLTTVSCWAPERCVAAGLGTQGNLIERWNGRKWSVMPGGKRALSGVSCVSAGTDADGAFIATWDGTSWTSQPAPATDYPQSLRAVSCVSRHRCVIAGYKVTTTRTKTLVEEWNGTAWRVRTTPNPVGKRDVFIGGVSCTDRFSCAVVGWAGVPPGRTTLALVSH